jgi:potassium-transporting ATPase KdpC subunit
MKAIIPAIRMFVILTLLTGVIYPLVITAAAGVVLPYQANGSLERDGETIVGSALIGQITYTLDENGAIANLDAINPYFWGRPSAVNYMLGSSPDALGVSSGSNLGMTSATLQAAVQAREVAFRAANNVPDDVAIPREMLFASASGLDPHISPQAAELQVERVAAARGIEAEQVAQWVLEFYEQPQFGILGEPRVNVFLLNRALDGLE